MDKKALKKLRDASNGSVFCDLVITNAMALDVFSKQWFLTDISIKDGVIVALDERPSNKKIDVKGSFVTPGLIDAHLHIESTLITPDTLNDILLPHGVTTIVTDPHEIANVSGAEGIKYMTDASKQLDLEIITMLPSCVPSTPLENAGAVLSAAELEQLYGLSNVHGLAEVMDSPAVAGSEDMLNKLYDAITRNVVIDGHGATLDNKGLDLYATMNIATDHETITPEGLIERVRRGFYVHVRQGTVTKNLEALFPAISYKNADRICFCSDDKHLDDLVNSGGIDDVVRQAIGLGLEPALAFSIATKSPAACYGLKYKGAVAPGYIADLVVWDENHNAKYVYKAAKLVAKGGQVINKKGGTVAVPLSLLHSVNPAPVNTNDLALPTKGKSRLNVIGVEAGNVITNHQVMDIPPADFFTPDPKRDLAKLAVIERHHALGNVSVCAVTGFGLKEGAIATTVAHDSHNIIVVGASDEDILIAVNALSDMQGGYVVVKEKKVIAQVALELAGLMTHTEPKKLLTELESLHTAAEQILTQREFNPFQMLSFISLPVIPYLKLTDKGLVDVMKFGFIPAAE